MHALENRTNLNEGWMRVANVQIQEISQLKETVEQLPLQRDVLEKENQAIRREVSQAREEIEEVEGRLRVMTDESSQVKQKAEWQVKAMEDDLKRTMEEMEERVRVAETKIQRTSTTAAEERDRVTQKAERDLGAFHEAQQRILRLEELNAAMEQHLTYCCASEVELRRHLARFVPQPPPVELHDEDYYNPELYYGD